MVRVCGLMHPISSWPPRRKRNAPPLQPKGRSLASSLSILPNLPQASRARAPASPELFYARARNSTSRCEGKRLSWLDQTLTPAARLEARLTGGAIVAFRVGDHCGQHFQESRAVRGIQAREQRPLHAVACCAGAAQGLLPGHGNAHGVCALIGLGAFTVQ